MFSGLTGWHALLLLAVVVLIFGATRLPSLAKSIGQSMKIFRNEIKSDDPPADGGKADGSGSTPTDTK